jgi:hypothetical protein
MPEKMQEQIITGACAMDIGDGGVFGARVGTYNDV